METSDQIFTKIERSVAELNYCIDKPITTSTLLLSYNLLLLSQKFHLALSAEQVRQERDK